jgi:subtilisin family serine protease
MSRPQVLKRLVTLAVLLSLCSAPFVSSSAKAHAANGGPATVNNSTKISPDLRQLILSGQGDKRVKVIVQQVEQTGGLLDGLLNTVGGLLEGVLSLLNIRIVNVQVNDIELLATDPNVSYISLDTAVVSSGHLTTTTGTQQVRTQKTLLGTITLDGAGVSIAVLDSGIDKTHK